MNITYCEGSIADVLDIDAQVPEFHQKNNLEKITQRLAGKRFLVLVAFDGDKKVGYKLGYLTSESELYSWSGAVHPDYRGQGIAKALLKRQEKWAVDNDIHSISVKSMNQFPAMLQLLISQGYQIEGYEDKGTPQQSKICFVKQLNISL